MTNLNILLHLGLMLLMNQLVFTSNLIIAAPPLAVGPQFIFQHHKRKSYADAEYYCNFVFGTSLAKITNSTIQTPLLTKMMNMYNKSSLVLSEPEVWIGSDYNGVNTGSCMSIGVNTEIRENPNCNSLKNFICLDHPTPRFIAVRTPREYFTANNHCKSTFGSFLATIRTQEEQDLAFGLMFGETEIYIGANDDKGPYRYKNKTGWLWESGIIVPEYHNFGIEQPEAPGQTHCVMMKGMRGIDNEVTKSGKKNPNITFAGEWDDAFGPYHRISICDNDYSFSIQVPPPRTESPTTLTTISSTFSPTATKPILNNNVSALKNSDIDIILIAVGSFTGAVLCASCIFCRCRAQPTSSTDKKRHESKFQSLIILRQSLNPWNRSIASKWKQKEIDIVKGFGPQGNETRIQTTAPMPPIPFIQDSRVLSIPQLAPNENNIQNQLTKGTSYSFDENSTVFGSFPNLRRGDTNITNDSSLSNGTKKTGISANGSYIPPPPGLFTPGTINQLDV